MVTERKSEYNNNRECKDRQGDRITVFAFKKNDTGVDIKIIGCFRIKLAPNQPFYSKGIITVQGRPFSVFDLQALAGLKPKTVTDESCIVLMDSNEGCNSFSRAIIVDNVTEMLNIADRNMAGAGMENIFSSQLDAVKVPASPDFPDLEKQQPNTKDQPCSPHTGTQGIAYA